MSLRLTLPKQEELATTRTASLSDVRRPSHGRYLEDFVPGQVFEHPRGLTLDRGFAKLFAMSFLQYNPLYTNVDYARAHGLRDQLISPQLVFNTVLSLGVQNDSEKATANLGYYHARFLRPVYPGDTLRSLSKVMERKERGDKPGIVTLRTVGVNQNDEIVLQYERKIMVAFGPDAKTKPVPPMSDKPFPWEESFALHLPLAERFPANLTGKNTYWEDFASGQVIVHPNGRTMTDEHMIWTWAVGNTHPLHYDALYSRGLSGAMSGEPIIYGGLVFAWLDGLATRDLSENAVWDLGFTEGYHTQPTVKGDTIAALTRILDVAELPGEPRVGIVTAQFVGVKNLRAAQALERYGTDLFLKEGDKKERGLEKIPEKIFEIERQWLVKRRLL